VKRVASIFLERWEGCSESLHWMSASFVRFVSAFPHSSDGLIMTN
jgi:hypothetical protein